MKKNIIKSFWNGEVPLWISYWIIGAVGGNILVRLDIFYLSDKFNLPWGSIFLPYWIFCSVGIWRSSNNYKGKKIWSHLTKTIITACYVMLFLYFLYL